MPRRAYRRGGRARTGESLARQQRPPRVPAGVRDRSAPGPRPASSGAMVRALFLHPFSGPTGLGVSAGPQLWLIMRRPRNRIAVGLLITLLPGCSGDGATLRSPTGDPTEDPEGAGTPMVTLDAGTAYQTITGWEATAESGESDAPSFPLYRDTLFAQAADLGINRFRLQIQSGVENSRDYYSESQEGRIDGATWRCVRYATVNDNADPSTINWSGFHFTKIDEIVEKVVLPYRARLQASGRKLFINLNYVAFATQCPNTPYIHHAPEEYAEFILATSIHLRDKYNLVPDAWEVILEPDNTSVYWPGRAIGEAIVATARRLESAGFQPRFIGPSTTRAGNAIGYLNGMLSVPGAQKYLAEFSYHRYDNPSPSVIQAIGDRGAQAGIATAMLEHIGSGYEDLHEDLKLARNTAWQQFTLAYPASADRGATYFPVQGGSSAAPTVEPGSRTKFLRQYFRFIRPGARRIGAQSDNAAVDPLAFINPDGNYVIVVKTTGQQTFDIAGLPAGVYGVSYTTSSQAGVDAPEVNLAAGARLRTRIPDRGVITIFRR